MLDPIVGCEIAFIRPLNNLSTVAVVTKHFYSKYRTNYTRSVYYSYVSNNLKVVQLSS